MQHRKPFLNLLTALSGLMFIALLGASCGTSSQKTPSTTNAPAGAPINAANSESALAYVNNPKSDNISGLSANNQKSTVSAIPGSPFPAPSYPIDVAASGDFLFVASTGVNALNSAEFVLTTYRVDAASGALTNSSTLNLSGIFSGGGYPNNIVVDPAGKFLYMSVTGGQDPGGPRILVFSIDANAGTLSEVTNSPFVLTEQFTAYHMAISPDGGFLFAAVFEGTGGGFVAPPHGVQVIARDQNSGTLSTPLLPLAEASTSLGHAEVSHLAVTPSGNFLVGTAISMNTVFVWSIDSNTGALTQVSNFGDPVHTNTIAPMGVAIDPSGKFVIVANSQSSNVSVFSLSSTGTLTAVPGSPFPGGNGPTSVAISASGNLVFVGNVGSNDMSVFQLDAATGKLTGVQGSPFPIGTSAFNLMTVVTIH